MDLLLNPETSQQLDAYLKQPSHALLIEGQPGGGKGTIAQHIASQILNLHPEKLANYAFFLRVEPTNNTISIETIRNIQEFMKLKSLGQKPLRRVVIVENAHRMTVEAQNAFLKLLEEPPPDTVIILTAPHNQTLLPTIYSRVQRIQIKAPPEQALKSYFESNNYNSTEIERIYSISDGQIGLMHALLFEDEEHPLAVGITEAKNLLGMTRYDRLKAVDGLAKDKEHLPDLLQAMRRIYQAVLLQASQKNQTLQIKQAHRALKRITEAQTELKHNPNTKLLLTDIMLNL